MSGSNGSQQYCLRWNNYQNNLTNVFDQLLQSESFVDVTLACDGESLKCHKMILSACSPFFQNLFFQNPCTHPIVILKDMRWEDLKAVVDFMYRGEINVSQDQLTPLLKVAAALKIRGLADVSQRTGLTGSSASKNQADHETSDKKGDLPKANNVSDSCLTESDPLSAPLSTFSKGLSSLRRKRPRISSPERNASSEEDEHSRDPNDFLSASGCDSDMEHSSSSYLAQGFQDSPASNLLAESLGPSSFVSTSINNGVSANILCSGGSTPGIHNVPTSVSMSLMNMHNSMAAASTSSTQSSIPNEMDLKPGIVEMIREEERAKMLESSFGWTGGPSPAALSDTYQYQLQSLWQKCWSNNQSNNPPTLRFRERGPMKSWRPETMAEAIFAVLREGLSLSQAARKYDIPYPTFVLYANRVHNMLGPSTDGCAGADMVSDMRPKGRGRPQRILLGSWPEDHVRGVIRAVVFRDPGGKEDPLGVSRDTNYGLGSQPSATVTNGNEMRNSPPFNANCGSAQQNFFNQHRSQTGVYDATVSSGLSDSKLSKSFPSPGMQLTLRGSASLMDGESLKNGAAKSEAHSRLLKSVPSVASYPHLDNQECSMSDLVSDITEDVQVKSEIAYECLEEQEDVFGVSEQQISGHNKTSEVPSEASQVDRDLEKNLQGVVDDQNSNEAPKPADKVDDGGQNVSSANHFSAS